MLLNNFLYNRSLLQNEQFQNRKSFSSLVPKTSITSDVNKIINDEFQEEIKMVVLQGGKEKNDEIKELEDKLEKKEKEIKNKKRKIGEKKEVIEEKQKVINEKEDIIEEKEEIIDDKEEIIDDKEEIIDDKEEEIDDLEDEIKDLEEKHKECEEDENEKGKKDTKEYFSHQHKDNEIIFDNLKKGGGTNEDKTIKNVVVSFF